MRVTVPSLAKLNLDLRVLGRHADGFHEIRTIFQTISLSDRITIEFEPGRRGSIQLDSSIDIPDNLVLRAANLVMDKLKIRASVHLGLEKTIPMGAGLGGGSSNAAAMLIALPALAQKKLSIADAVAMARSLGSDVPFFLFGGTALGIGRGSELYPLPEPGPLCALVVHTGVHVSTATAYRSLGRPIITNALTSPAELPILGEFQTVAWNLNRSNLGQLPLQNDFEEPVFASHPELAATARKLRRLGARSVRMTGSGSAIFGLYSTAAETEIAGSKFASGHAFPVRFVSRKQFLKLWSRALRPFELLSGGGSLLVT